MGKTPAPADESFDTKEKLDDIMPDDDSKRRREPIEDRFDGAVTLDDFYALMPQHLYLFTPSRDFWPAVSVNARISPVKIGTDANGEARYMRAATWLDRHRPIEQLTWSPGDSDIIDDRLIDQGGWIDRPGCRCFNLYRGPQPGRSIGRPLLARRWTDHVHRVYGDAADHVIRWLAHRVQRPGEKINHALVLGGKQGIGKDSLLEPVKHAVGPWNWHDVTPPQVFGRFNGFVKSVILRISEARDLGDIDRFGFYDHLKNLAAAPPDVLRCDEKNVREYAVRNVCGVIITTNHLTDGIYLPADDRRHFVAWSECGKDDFTPAYWRDLWDWYDDAGIEHVTAYLRSLDLSGFDAKAPPPKTAAFWSIVDANRAPEDAELADAIDRLGRPQATTLPEIASCAENGFSDWIRDRKNSRQVPHRLEAVGYVPVRNDSQDGRWKVGGRNLVVYARSELSIRDRLVAVRMFVEAKR